MCGLVEANLDLCVVPEENTEVVLSEAAEFVRRASARGGPKWDTVFFDPPYVMDYLPVLVAFETGAVLEDEGVLVVEHHHKTALKETIGEIRRWRILKQGDSTLSFYRLG